MQIQFLNTEIMGSRASRRYLVDAGTTAIAPGEPVAKALGQRYAAQMATNKPVVGTDFLAGIAVSNSTQTTSVDGYVDVVPVTSKDILLIAPNSAAAFDTQAEYDALVGDRVLIDLTTGTFTLLATDGANNGCVIEWIDIKDHPGKVAFSFRDAVNYLA